MCKGDDRPPHQKSNFFIASKTVYFSTELTLKESLEMFITEYVPSGQLHVQS